MWLSHYMTDQRQEVTHYKIFHQKKSPMSVWTLNNFLSWKNMQEVTLEVGQKQALQVVCALICR